MSTLDKTTATRLERGLNKDFTFQQPGDVTYALNAIRDNIDGGKAEYQSEPGNSQSFALPLGYEAIGTIYGTDNKVFVFSVNAAGTRSEIGVSRAGNYDTLVNADLDFNSYYPISGKFRVRNGCDEVIYWSDHLNPDRWFNVSKPELFQTGGFFDPNKFAFNPELDVPNIELVNVNDSGGSLPLGSYYIQIEILDRNENTIYKTDVSPQTVIYDESQSDGFNTIDGGLNIAQYDPYIGGVPLTNKSITYRFSNLDTAFAYIRVSIARQIAGTQVIDAHQVGQLIPISSDAVEWTYTGYNVNAGDTPLDYSSMLTESVKYQSSYVNEQVEGRYLRANLKQSVRDYSTYQIQASQIRTQWVSDTASVANAKAVGNSKNPHTYWLRTTFQGDEVYALGIRYLHSDGSFSPVFHIPGRSAETSDLELLTVVTNGSTPAADEVWLSDIEHLPDSEFTTLTNDYLGSTIERWRVFNTATRTLNYGDMGYYEADTTYPDIRDCDDNLIWGEDFDGNEITTSTKIRHHRFPDRKLLSHYNGSHITILGVMFDNINYPSSDIVGHQFVHGTRDEFNKTVLDSGWAVEPDVTDDVAALTGAFATLGTANNFARYNSAEIFFNKKLFNADYLKINRAYHLDSQPVVFPGDFASYPIVETGDDKTLWVNIYHMIYDSDMDTDRTNYKINNQVYLPPNSYTGTANFPISVDNTRNKFTADSMIHLNYSLEDISALGSQSFGQQSSNPGSYIFNNFYVYKKNNNKPFSNLFGIRYQYINFNPVYSTNLGDNAFFGGDSIISLVTVFRDQLFEISDDEKLAEPISYLYMYEERQINGSLRHAGNDPDTTYYKINSDNLHFMNKIADLNEDEKWVIRQSDSWRTEYYDYNPDYDVQDIAQAKIQLPFNYDYCSLCSGIYRNRIVWSPKSFDEENFDLYRVTQTNDYIDLPGHRGAITGMVYKSGYLIVRTTETTFVLKPFPQTLSTDQSSVYLTSGSFLSIPPEEIAQSDVGYAGMQSKMAEVNTPLGLYWTDQKRGQVFRFTTKLEELSSAQFGLSQWFKQNLPSAMDNEFLRVFNEHYPHIDSTIATAALGTTMFYDPRYRRVFIHKKDYYPIGLVEENPFINEITFSFIDEQFLDNEEEGIRYWEASNFENRSWTISFSEEYNSWTSWHSYFPYLAFSDENYYYTFNPSLSRNRAWRHDHYNNYQKFYGTKADFIVEFMVADYSTDSLDTVHYVGYTHDYDEVRRIFKPVDDVTFNRMMCYNDYQNTGILTLTSLNQHTSPYGNIASNSTVKNVIKTNDHYKVSELYDMAVGIPVISSNWTDIQTSYPIDIVPFNIDTTKSQYDWGNLSDKFIFVRLYFKPASDYRKTVNLIQTNESYVVT